MRVALCIEYDGTSFSGWQIQKGAPSIQEHVENALSRVANHEIRVACAGRTDAGVHATGQIVHFETTAIRDPRAWVFGANANLPKAISVIWAHPVADDFHARFSAVRRRYRYIIFCREVRPTFLAYRVTWSYRALNTQFMGEAARLLVGEHDFSSYRALGCQAKHAVRTITQLDVIHHKPFVFIDVEANAFLHHMVRNIAGVLMAIGAQERDIGWAKEVLDARDRTLGGVTAPPHGLYLERVYYPSTYQLPDISPSTLPW